MTKPEYPRESSRVRRIIAATALAVLVPTLTLAQENADGSVAALKLALLELRPEDVERGWQ
jgi:hypothetical protein